MRRLYLRIYLAVLASVVLSVVLAGLAWRIFADPDRGPSPAAMREAAIALLPPPAAGVEAQRAALERWSALTGFDLALLDRDGRLIASAGRRGEALGTAPRREGPFGPMAVRTGDGRTLVAARGPPTGPPFRGFGFFSALLVAAGAVALCAWPVVRRLTRDLETLERNVAAFGVGELAARAHVRSKDEVGRLAATFNATADRIEALMRANRTLLANASHELRSPLARLRMGVEGLGADAPARLREELSRNIRELDQLVDEILIASRIDAGAVEAPMREDVDLVALAAEECARTGADLDARAQRPLKADPRLLRRAIRNLLENAVRHGGGGFVEASVTADGAALNLDVCDRGPGVPEGEREKIFEPFYRMAGASEASGGVGLGLSLARKIARLHGGSLVCLPRDGGGSCFRLTLPRGPESW